MEPKKSFFGGLSIRNLSVGRKLFFSDKCKKEDYISSYSGL